MKNTLTISSLNNVKGFFPTSYNVQTGTELKKRVLLSNLHVSEVALDKSPELYTIIFDDKNLYTHIIDLTLLDSSVIVGLKKFFSEMPLCVNMANSKPSEIEGHDYGYIISEEKIDFVITSEDEIVDCVNKYKALSREEQDAIAIHFAVSPWGQEAKHLRTSLVGLSEGIITQSKDKRNEFLNKLDTMFDPKVLNVRAAIIAGIIVNDERIYKVQDRVLGYTIDDCIAYINKDEGMYALIVRMLREQGKLIELNRDIKGRQTKQKSEQDEALLKAAKKEQGLDGLEEEDDIKPFKRK